MLHLCSSLQTGKQSLGVPYRSSSDDVLVARAILRSRVILGIAIASIHGIVATVSSKQ
jgi:cobalamin biosynthesis protein CbiG